MEVLQGAGYNKRIMASTQLRAIIVGCDGYTGKVYGESQCQKTALRTNLIERVLTPAGFVAGLERFADVDVIFSCGDMPVLSSEHAALLPRLQAVFYDRQTPGCLEEKERTMERESPNAEDDFFFDLHGYLLLKNAISRDLVERLNRVLDGIKGHETSRWQGLHNIVEAGQPFEDLIDHPSWLERVRRFAGEGEAGKDLFIDECFAIVNQQGSFTPIHSGGHEGLVRTQYRYFNGRFHCGQVNILLALTDIGPGDGATTVIPGSHKSNLIHPQIAEAATENHNIPCEEIKGAEEVTMERGDALLFVDALCHGSARRTNAGERRVVIYRYGPAWSNSRYGYQPSPELLERLTPQRRNILQPIPPKRPSA